MKPFLIALTIMICAATAQAADVGVSVSIGQPGFYGRIDIGDFPRPHVIHQRPIVIVPPHGRIVEEPIYLRVPPGHAKKWRKHCGKYNACGRPVYFVQDRWYNDVYVPRYRESRIRHSRASRWGNDWYDGDDDGGYGYDRD